MGGGSLFSRVLLGGGSLLLGDLFGRTITSNFLYFFFAPTVQDSIVGLNIVKISSTVYMYMTTQERIKLCDLPYHQA